MPVELSRLLWLLMLSVVLFVPVDSFAATNVDDVVTRIKKQAPALKPTILRKAVIAYQHAKKQGVMHKPIVTVIDYSMPSSKKRLWTIDLNRKRVLFHTYVAHGLRSGALYATRFSNAVGSKASSLGVYVTASTYIGNNGLSLRLRGLEKGINDKAMSRAVVMHGARYVSQQFIRQVGRLGRSWGCPAVPKNMIIPMIRTLKNGSLLLAYYPQKYWLSHSKYVA